MATYLQYAAMCGKPWAVLGSGGMDEREGRDVVVRYTFLNSVHTRKVSEGEAHMFAQAVLWCTVLYCTVPV